MKKSSRFTGKDRGVFNGSSGSFLNKITLPLYPVFTILTFFFIALQVGYAHDDKVDAILLSDLNAWCSANAAYTSIGMTADESKGSCWNNGPNYNTWFKFQATTTDIQVILKTGGVYGSMRYPFLTLWDDVGGEIACNSYSTPYDEIEVTDQSLTIGNWYYISVDNYVGSNYRGTYSLCISDVISYDYDFHSGAQLLSDLNSWCSANGAYETTGATADESKGSCWNNGPSYNRWFKFQATTTEIKVDVKTGGAEGTLEYAYVALWDDVGGELACEKYVSASSDLEMQYTGLTIGNWYYISVDNYTGPQYTGTFTLCVADIFSNDYRQGATELTDLDDWCSADGAFTTLDGSPDQFAGSCWDNGPNYNRWFKFQATSIEVQATVRTGGAAGTMRYPFITLWDNGGTEITCRRYDTPYDTLVMLYSGLTPGNWYYISVDNYEGHLFKGTFTLCISDDIHYDYDHYQGSTTITDLNNWCSADAAYTTFGATADQAAGSCWDNGPNYNRWFKFQATTTSIEIELKTGGSEGTLRYPFLALWDDGLTELACRRYHSIYGDLELIYSGLTIGNWYYVSVDHFVGTSYMGTFTLCANDAPVYSSDYKEGATVLSDLNNWCSANEAYTTLGAYGDESAGSCWDNGPNYNRWFKFTATSADIQVQVKTGGSEGTLRYPFAALWDETLTEMGCARYYSQYGDIELIHTGLTPGADYYISVDNYAGTSYIGTFSLCISDNIVYGDDYKAGATILTDIDDWCSSDAAYSNLGATGDEPIAFCWDNGPNYNRWYKFQATTGEAQITLRTGGAAGTLRYPFILLTDAGGTQLACGRYSSAYDTLVLQQTGLTVGGWYFITVDNYLGSSYRGSYSLCVTDEYTYDFRNSAHELTDIANYCSNDAEFTTVDATGDESKGACWDNGPNYNRWFKFQATTTEVQVHMKTGGAEGSLRYPFLSLWDNVGTELNCVRYVSQYDDLEIINTSLTIGNWYYISADNYVGTGYRGTFTLCVSENVSFNNDYQAGATELTDLNNWCSADAAYTTVGATSDESAGSCWSNGPNYNRWFKFQATTNEVRVVAKCGGSFGNLQYPYIALWDDGLTELECDQYDTQYDEVEVQHGSLTIGNWYYITVDNFVGQPYTGSFTLCINDALSYDYDFKAGADTLDDLNTWCSANAAYTTFGATGDESKGSCWDNGPNYNRWFKFKATTTLVECLVKTGGAEGTLRYPYIALWTEAGTELACKRYGAQYSDLRIEQDGLTVNDWYYISVDNYTGAQYTGTFTLCIADDTTTLKGNGTPPVDFFRSEEDEVIGGRSITVYPNPTNGSVFLEFNSLRTEIEEQEYTIRIKDIYGKELDNSVQLWVTQPNEKLALDIDGFAPGIYLIVIESDEKTMLKKLVKH